MNLSNIVQKMISDWIKGSTTPAPTGLVVALSSAAPTMNGSGIQEPPSANGYTRQAITFGPETFVNNQGTTIKSSSPLVFGPCTNANWPPITHIAIYSAAGQLIAHGQLAAPRVVSVGDTYSTSLEAIQLLLR